MKNTRFICAAVIGLFAVSGCGRKEGGRPDVVMVAIDGLRADRLSAYGYKRQTTPFLDGLEMDGVSFRDAFAPSSWSAPSVASALTGLPPLRHGVRHGLVMADGRVSGQEAIAEGALPLAEMLTAAGYRSVAVSASPFTTKEKGYAKGFQTFLSLPGKSAKEIVLSAVGEASKGEEPLFLFIQVSDLAEPRRKPDTAAATFGAEVPEEVWTARWEELNRRAAGLQGQPVGPMDKAGAQRAFQMRQAELAILVKAVADAYDSVLKETDAAIAELSRGLGARRRETLWVVFGTHGMGFREHGGFGYGENLFSESIRVPLIFSGAAVPGGRPRVVGPCSLLDIPATVEEAATGQKKALGGMSLLPAMRSGRVPERRVLFCETLQAKDISERAVIAWPWKLMIRKDQTGFAEALFHEGLDGSNQKNVIQAQAGIAEELRQAARQWWGM